MGRQMKLIVRKSSPLRPLAGRARMNSTRADELWVASAFLSDDAVVGVVEPALEACANVRVLTGTFGRVTRLRTFQRLNRLGNSAALRTRIWPGDYHAKLFLWRTGRHCIAWVGSANFTGRGLQGAGELVAEVVAAWNSPPMRSLRAAFNNDWRDARDLDDRFLRDYREAPRPIGLLSPRRSPTRAPQSRSPEHRAMLVVPVRYHFAESSPTARRIRTLLGGTAHSWYSSSSKAIRQVRTGDLCMIADSLDQSLYVGVVTDTVSNGRTRVVAHQPFSQLPDPRLGSSIRKQLVGLGLHRTKSSFRTQWLDVELAAETIEALYGKAVRRRFERRFGPHLAASGNADEISAPRLRAFAPPRRGPAR